MYVAAWLIGGDGNWCSSAGDSVCHGTTKLSSRRPSYVSNWVRGRAGFINLVISTPLNFFSEISCCC